MRLKNKHTGEIVEYDSIGFRKGLSDGWEDFIAKAKSLAELNEDWEDYKGPLIEDEVLRNTIRTWAEKHGINKGTFEQCGCVFRYGNIVMTLWEGLPNLQDGTYYTIEELCGE